VPNSLPVVPHGGMRCGWKACVYTFLFKLVCSAPQQLQLKSLIIVRGFCQSRMWMRQLMLSRVLSDHETPSNETTTGCTSMMQVPWKVFPLVCRLQEDGLKKSASWRA
jgi:hypothetical protein